METKQEYIDRLLDDKTSWRTIKDEADKYEVEKQTDKTWDDMVPLIADVKFPSESEDSESQDAIALAETLSVTDEPTEKSEEPNEENVQEDAIAPSDSKSDLSVEFEYIREGRTLNCRTCGYPIRVSLAGTKICPVSNPDCPRPNPDEVN